MELTEKEIEEIKNYKPLDEEKYIINYLSDTDVYKISMTQCLLHKRPNEWAKWKWKLRSKDVHLGYLVDAVNREVDHLCTLRWQPFELTHCDEMDRVNECKTALPHFKINTYATAKV